MIIQRATINDAPEILNLQKKAFGPEAILYNDFNLPPLLETLEDTEKEFENKVILKTVIDGAIVGSIRAHLEGNTCYIGKLIVHPGYQNQSIGSKLMVEIENLFQKCGRFELFTGHKNLKNLYLYKKLGYKKFKEVSIKDGLIFFYFEKVD